jgi:hypothetical protein
MVWLEQVSRCDYAIKAGLAAAGIRTVGREIIQPHGGGHLGFVTAVDLAMDLGVKAAVFAKLSHALEVVGQLNPYGSARVAEPKAERETAIGLRANAIGPSQRGAKKHVSPVGPKGGWNAGVRRGGKGAVGFGGGRERCDTQIVPQLGGLGGRWCGLGGGDGNRICRKRSCGQLYRRRG